LRLAHRSCRREAGRTGAEFVARANSRFSGDRLAIDFRSLPRAARASSQGFRSPCGTHADLSFGRRRCAENCAGGLSAW
jgi:hypothetical protein